MLFMISWRLRWLRAWTGLLAKDLFAPNWGVLVSLAMSLAGEFRLSSFDKLDSPSPKVAEIYSCWLMAESWMPKLPVRIFWVFCVLTFSFLPVGRWVDWERETVEIEVEVAGKWLNLKETMLFGFGTGNLFCWKALRAFLYMRLMACFAFSLSSGHVCFLGFFLGLAWLARLVDPVFRSLCLSTTSSQGIIVLCRFRSLMLNLMLSCFFVEVLCCVGDTWISLIATKLSGSSFFVAGDKECPVSDWRLK